MGVGAVTAENAKVDYEAGQNDQVMTELTDEGDHLTFDSAVALWSNRSGHTPVVRPDGLITGGKIIPDDSEVSNKVDVAALTCYLIGVETSVNAGEVVCVRGEDANTDHIINSIIVLANGTLSVLTGTGAADAFSETRGAAGGPPLITDGCIEIGQVRFTSDSDGVVLASEIFQTPGTHLEKWNYPLWTVNYGPNKDDPENVIDGGSVTFLSALPLIHVGPTAKNVYASYAAPIFAEAQLASDFVPPETSHAVSSKQVYGTVVGGRSSTLGQGSFTVELQDGVTDGLVALKDQNLWFRFYPDRYKTPYILQQGKLGIARSFPASDSMTAACTISAASKAIEMES